MVLSYDLLQVLECATARSRHFLKEPKSLSCGHSICAQCINTAKCNNQDEGVDDEEVFCKFCDSDRVRLKMNSSKIGEFCIIQNLNELFRVTHRRYLKEFQDFQDKIKSVQNCVDKDIEAAIEETKALTEYLQFESDKDKIKGALEQTNGRIMNDLKSLIGRLNFNRTHETILEHMRQLIEENVQIDEDCFYEHQSKLQHLMNTNRSLDNFNCTIYCDKLVNIEDIGTNFDYSFKTVVDRLQTQLYGLIDVNETVCPTCDIAVLDDHRILTANYTSLNLYNEKFELIRQVNNFLACFITTNGHDRIYVCGCRKLIMMDYEFNVLKEAKCTDTIQFGDLAFSEGNLYVCDPTNNQIHVYDLEMEYCESVVLSFSPKSIEVKGSIACITHKRDVYFYEIKPRLQLKQAHLNHNCIFKSNNDFKTLNGSICFYDSFFYVFCSGFGKTFFNVYDATGSFVERIEPLNMLNSIEFANEHPIVCFNGNLILNASESKQRILI